MDEGERNGWQWADIPVPEPYVAGLFIGGIIHLLAPLNAMANQRLARAVGWPLIVIGLLIIGWAVRTFGDSDGQHPMGLVTTGPYAFTRNPMYIGWSALYLRIASVLNIAWLFVVFPAVVATCHRVVRREEQDLTHEFGDEYRTYRRKVRRYL